MEHVEAQRDARTPFEQPQASLLRMDKPEKDSAVSPGTIRNDLRVSSARLLHQRDISDVPAVWSGPEYLTLKQVA